jgi:hypothetical protein
LRWRPRGATRLPCWRFDRVLEASATSSPARRLSSGRATSGAIFDSRSTQKVPLPPVQRLISVTPWGRRQGCRSAGAESAASERDPRPHACTSIDTGAEPAITMSAITVIGRPADSHAGGRATIWRLMGVKEPDASARRPSACRLTSISGAVAAEPARRLCSYRSRTALMSAASPKMKDTDGPTANSVLSK